MKNNLNIILNIIIARGCKLSFNRNRLRRHTENIWRICILHQPKVEVFEVATLKKTQNTLIILC